MRVFGTIRGGTVQQLHIDGDDYLTAKAELLAQVPAGARLIFIRVER